MDENECVYRDVLVHGVGREHLNEREEIENQRILDGRVDECRQDDHDGECQPAEAQETVRILRAGRTHLS